MTLYEYLHQQQEDLPSWLDRFNPGDPFPREQFFASRVVYYPGSGIDGHPVKLFGGSHSAHCFVYADYGVNQDELEQQLEDPQHGFRGYHTLARLQLSEHDLVSGRFNPHTHAQDVPSFATTANSPFGFLEVLERDAKLDDNHGAPRLAIVFLGADGIASYDALFCQEHSGAPPFAVLLQDHGFSGNYNRFGRDGLLCDIASRCNVFPKFLVVADNTDPWDCYSQIKDIEPDMGGMHAHKRYLFKRVIHE